MTQPGTPEPPALFEWQADTVKGGERFNDILKSEQDRLSNKLKTGEDRARGNATAALAATGVLTLLRTATPTLPPWSLLVTLALVLGILGLMVAMTFNRTTNNITPTAMREERQALYDQGRSYMEIMLFYQLSVIENIDELYRLQRTKFILLDIQNVLLALLLVLLAGALLLALPIQ